MGQISMEISEPDGSAVGGNQQGPPFIDDGAERAAALFNSRSRGKRQAPRICAARTAS